MKAGRMERYSFRMVLDPGQADDYRRRHDELWPELAETLRAAGVSDYTIWLDPETNHLFATLLRPTDHGMDGLPEDAVVKKWWAFMADIMQTNPDNSPVMVDLLPMFEMN